MGTENGVVVDRSLRCHAIGHQCDAKSPEVGVAKRLDHLGGTQWARFRDETVKVHGLAGHFGDVGLHELVGARSDDSFNSVGRCC